MFVHKLHKDRVASVLEKPWNLGHKLKTSWNILEFKDIISCSLSLSLSLSRKTTVTQVKRVVNTDGAEFTDPKSIANVFNNFFVGVGATLASNCSPVLRIFLT